VFPPELGYFLYKNSLVRPEALVEGFTEFESKAMSEHFNYLKDLTEKSIVILAGPTLVKDFSNFGIVIFKAETEKEAGEIMHGDPAIMQCVMRAELYPFKISLFNPAGVQN
jgi:uncharacterized protein YciI